MTLSTKPQWAISVNGHIGNEFTASVAVMDRGFLFGDSVYETTSTRNGVLMFWEDHFTRLQRSARGLDFDLTCTKESLFRDIRDTALSGRFAKDLYVRVIISRGFSQDISLFPQNYHTMAPTRIALLKNLPLQPERLVNEGMNLAIVQRTKRNSPRSIDPALKTGNYLNSVLAMIEAKGHEFDDAVMLNHNGEVTEGTTFNIWGVRSGELYTPALECGLLDGITRHHIKQVAQLKGITCHEKKISVEELLSMDEIFVSSAIRHILPVHRLNEKTFSAEKPITRMLMKEFDAYCENYARTHAQWSVQRAEPIQSHPTP